MEDKRASLVWVNVPLFTSNTTIWATCGNGNTTPYAYTTNGSTWNSGYVGVWHLKQPNAMDSTTNQNNMTAQSANLSVTTGPFGEPALNFPNTTTNDFLSAPQSNSENITNALTIEAWVLASNASGQAKGVLAKRLSSSTTEAYTFFEFTAGDMYSDIGGGNGSPRQYATTPLVTSVWTHVAVTWSHAASNRMFFINGATNLFYSNDASTIANIVSPLTIGILNAGYNYPWVGKLDEVRLSNVARSKNWMWATYQNMASNAIFATFGAAQSADYGLPCIVDLAATNIAATSADAEGQLTSTGAAPAYVTCFWGDSDGGTNAVNWAHAMNLGAGNVGPIATPLTGLWAARTYYYRYFATNALGAAWAPATTSLTTGQPNGPVYRFW